MVLFRLAFVLLLLFWANPQLPVWILLGYFTLQYEALVMRANRETQRVNELIAVLDGCDGDGETGEASEAVLTVPDESTIAQLVAYWDAKRRLPPEQRH